MTAACLPPKVLPDLLGEAASRAGGLGYPSYIALHGLFRAVAARGLGVDLDDDEGHQAAVKAADELVAAVAEHLVFHGQHPHSTPRKTVADWMNSARLSTVRDELADAAGWWRSLMVPGRLM